MENKKVYKPWVVYKADKKTKEIHKPFFYKDKPDFSRMIALEGHRFIFFFYNKDSNLWAIPQNCNQKDKELQKEIAIAFKKIKLATTESVMRAVFPKLILERCKLEIQLNSIKKANEEFFRRKAEYSQAIKNKNEKEQITRLERRYKIQGVEKLVRSSSNSTR